MQSNSNLPDNPFLQLSLPRAKAALHRLEAEIWLPGQSVEVGFGGSRAEFIGLKEACRLKYEKQTLPVHWGKLFDQGWFRIQLPKLNKGGEYYLHWYDQGEATLYHEEVPWYGFDVAHRFCRVPEGGRIFYLEALCLQSAIWHPDAKGLDKAGSCLSAVQVCQRNDIVWEVYHDLKFLFDLGVEMDLENKPYAPSKYTQTSFQPPIELVSVAYRKLLRWTDDAVNALDAGGPGAMRKVLRQAYADLAGQHERIKAVLTGHAHIDLVWLWPERSAEFKAVHTFSSMNRLMDEYPEMIFGYSQPASYDAVGRLNPGLMDQVRKRIRQGKWEPVGATEVESDTLLACGEALARSFLIGQEGFERLQGKPSEVLWIPDVFGYCGCLPQIMVQTGVKYFFTTKLTWSHINRFPHSSFRWRGTDGSEVLVHVSQELGYNQEVSPQQLRLGARAYRQADVHDAFLCPTGYGDGGGGVTWDMCERVRRAASIAGMPETGWGRIDGFFKDLEKVEQRLPVHQGELYLECHRGVFTSHGNLKEAFRAGERALQVWEAAHCASGHGAVDVDVWRRMVFAQFHDYIPGSSIAEVYEEALPELGRIVERAGNAVQKVLNGRGTAAKAESVFNPLPVERIEVLELADGSQKAVRLAPLSGALIDQLEVVVAAEKVRASNKRLQSGLADVRFNAAGEISSLSFNGKAIAARSALGQLSLYPDFPHQFDAWEIDRQTLSLGVPVRGRAESVEVIEKELEASVAFTRKLGERSSVTIRYRLDAVRPVLQVEYEVDWQEERQLLKVHFPTAYAGRQARFGSPFGSVLRGQQAGNLHDEAMFEVPASRWAAVFDDTESEGLALVTEAKYGFSCRDGVLGLSLLRSPHITGEAPGYSGVVPKELRRGNERPLYCDIGRHVIRLALSPHDARAERGLLAPALADSLYTRLVYYRGARCSSGLLGMEGGESLVPCWAKPEGEGKSWILRLHETLGQRGQVVLKVAPGWVVQRSDLSGVEGGPILTSGKLQYRPYELISLRFTLEC